MTKPRTLHDKIWDDHLVDEQPDGTCLLYIDRHLVHEVTSPQAFEGLRMTGRKVHAPEKTLLVVDHNVPTSDRSLPNPDPESAEQIETLAQNARDFGLEYYNEFDKRQGIVHIIGPEQGFTLPGTTIVCGDSHHPRHHRRDRHRGRHRLRAGICRRGDPLALDGRPHDDLQHVDRRRRQG